MSIGRWFECCVDSDYEINDEYPHNIRRKGSKTNIAISIYKKTGYLRCTLNRKKYLHHRVVGLQFVENDNPLRNTVIDHINNDRTDNHTSNLRWVSQSENSFNRSVNNHSKYEHVDKLNKDCIKIETYGGRTLVNYYYDVKNDLFYQKITDDKFRLMTVSHCKDNTVKVYMIDSTGVRFSLYVKKFKRDNGYI